MIETLIPHGIVIAGILLTTFAIGVLFDWLTGRPIKKFLGILIIGLFPTIFCLFLLQRFSPFVAQQGNYLQRVEQIGQVFKNKNLTRKASEQFIDSNFLLINTSTSYISVKDSSFVMGDEVNHISVNQKKLRDALTYLISEPRIDLVVCDIVFNSLNSLDTALNRLLKKLADQDRLILPYDNDAVKPDNIIYFGLPGTVYGIASQNAQEEEAGSTMLADKKIGISLPYLMYLKIKKIKRVKYTAANLWFHEDGNPDHRVFPGYIPNQSFQDEDHFFSDRRRKKDENLASVSSIDTLEELSLPIFYNLPQLSTASGQKQIDFLLRAKNGRLPTIAFIGSFTGNRDIHQTPYGSLRGTTILINDFYQIMQGKYKLSKMQLAAYIVTLLIGFCLILRIILWNVQRKEKTPSSVIKQKFSRYFWELAIVIGNLFLEGLPYLLLFALTIVVHLVFDRFLNLLPLLIYFAAFQAIVSLFKKYHVVADKKNPKT